MTEQKTTTQPINLMEEYQVHEAAAGGGGPAGSPLTFARIGSNPRLLVIFTHQAVKVQLHHLDSSEFKGHLRCNGQSCVLCKAGYHTFPKVIYPVYNPLTHRVELLSVDESYELDSTLAKLRPLIKPGAMTAMLIKHTDFVFTIIERELLPSMTPDAGVIERFLNEWEQGLLDLASIYKRMDNDELKAIPEVAMVL